MHDTRVDTAWLNLSRRFSDVDNGDCAISILSFLFFLSPPRETDAISRIRRSKSAILSSAPRLSPTRRHAYTRARARRSWYRIAARCTDAPCVHEYAPKGIFIARYIHTTRNISARERRCIINDIFTRSAIRPRIPQEATGERTGGGRKVRKRRRGERNAASGGSKGKM